MIRPTTIREAVETEVRETAEKIRTGITSFPRRPWVVMGTGDCALSHGAKTTTVGGEYLFKITWPRQQLRLRRTPALEVKMGADGSESKVEEAISAMEEEAPSGTEQEFRRVLDALLAIGVSAAVLKEEVDAAVVRSVMQS